MSEKYPLLLASAGSSSKAFSLVPEVPHSILGLEAD
jgi:hypothetical protein